jgi:hypothetical protein
MLDLVGLKLADAALDARSGFHILADIAAFCFIAVEQ